MEVTGERYSGFMIACNTLGFGTTHDNNLANGIVCHSIYVTKVDICFNFIGPNDHHMNCKF